MNKKIIQTLVIIFAQVSTAIFVFSSIYISICFGQDVNLDLSYVWGVLFIAFISSIARIPLLGDREFSKTKMLVANIIYFLFVNILVLVTGYFLEWFYITELKMTIGIEITIIVVYIVTMLIAYKLDSQEAEKMNQKLKDRQKE